MAEGAETAAKEEAEEEGSKRSGKESASMKGSRLRRWERRHVRRSAAGIFWRGELDPRRRCR